MADGGQVHAARTLAAEAEGDIRPPGILCAKDCYDLMQDARRQETAFDNRKPVIPAGIGSPVSPDGEGPDADLSETALALLDAATLPAAVGPFAPGLLGRTGPRFDLGKPSEQPAIAAAPRGPGVPNIPGVPGVPRVSVAPDRPETPLVPDLPDAPDTRQTPDVPETPDQPDTPDMPETPDTPDNPDTP